MHLEQLRITGLRCLSSVSISLTPGINLFVGSNGAGKTSILESAYLLSHGRSFRSGGRDALVQRDASELSIFAELSRGNGQPRRLGLGRVGPRWEARVDGSSCSLGSLVRECAVVCFEPGSHALIAGAAEERRRYLDWGVFHVEQDFIQCWRRYHRALKQRNSLLRTSSVAAEAIFSPWEQELATTGVMLDEFRRAYLDRLRPSLIKWAAALLPEMGAPDLRYRRGWTDAATLALVLEETRGRDLARGHTTIGAHRADWSITFEMAPLREHLSRGQEKLTALTCLLAQAELYGITSGDWPIICLDDLASELDLSHQAALVEHLTHVQAQVLISGTEIPEPLRDIKTTRFHVEQGHLTRLL